MPLFPPQGVGGVVGGIRKLSELEIDTDKDWLGFRIRNIGAPTTDADVPRARAEDILSGVFDVARIPNLDASKITSGVFSLDRIPTITRAKLEYPTEDVNLGYLLSINKAKWDNHWGDEYWWILITVDFFADKGIETIVAGLDSEPCFTRRSAKRTYYGLKHLPSASTADFAIDKVVNGACSRLATESVDLPENYKYLEKLSSSGSTHKAFRTDMTTPKLTVTDTSISSGSLTVGSFLSRSYPELSVLPDGFLRAPSTRSPSAQTVIEVELTTDEPYRPILSSNIVEIENLQGLPDFLYREAKRYSVLKTKGFTDEEIELILGYIPQHQIDLNAVTWGAFELSPESPTNVITIQSDNPYQSGAVIRQVEFIERKGLRKFNPPKDFREAVELYNTLKRDFPHWLAGKDNFAYQCMGWEILEDFQNVDFYYGEFLEHQTHYNQLKQVPDFEIENRLAVLEDKLSRVDVLIDERDKHIAKLKEIEKKGW